MNEEEYTVEELQELIRIQKMEIRQTAKTFLVDELPILAKQDPNKAIQELDNFRGLLGTMNDAEVMYLLGHMYAREGEDDKAITMFDSALRERMDADTRQMLNLVMYRKLTNYLNIGNRAAATDLLKAVVFDNNNSANYFPTYLYLYSDLVTDSNKYEDAIELVQSYNENRNIVINQILPTKQKLLANLNAVDLGAFYQNPNQTNYDKISNEVNQIIVDLTAINNQIISMRGMIYINELQAIHESEMQNLATLQNLLLEYANAPGIIASSLEPARYYLSNVKETVAIYDAWLYRFDQLLDSRYQQLLKSGTESDLRANTSQLYLDKLIQTDNTLFLFNETISEIDEMLASGKYPQHQAELSSRRDDAMRQKADLELRREQYIAQIDFPDDTERAIFLEHLASYNSMLEEKQEMGEAIGEIESFIFVDIRTELEEQVKDILQPRITGIVGDVSNVSGRHDFFGRDREQALADSELITLQMSYRRLMDAFHLYLVNQSKLPENERLSMQREFRQEQRLLAQDIESFLSEHPNFNFIEQPGGGTLANAADLYYKLGELQYYSQPEDMLPALQSYNIALQIDPQLPERDLALYNIAFISSELKRAEVDNNKIAYSISATYSSEPPANSLYNEENFKETLNALKEIVRDFPESRMYDEAIYRLGLLNFKFAEDSKSPAGYHNIAVDYFNQLLENPEGAFYYDAIYQRGWVRMNSYQEEDLRAAVEDFLSLLRAIDQGKISDPDVVQDYRKDAVNNIGYCLAAIDGTNWAQEARGITELRRIFDDNLDPELINQMLDLATGNKYKMSAMAQVADFLRFRVVQNPLYLQNPTYLDSMLVLYANSTTALRGGLTERDMKRSIYTELTTDYNHKSAWFEHNKDKDIRPQMEIVNGAYKELNISLFNDFVRERNRSTMDAYMARMDEYTEFVQNCDLDFAKFQADKDSIYVELYAALAEHTMATQDMVEASQKIREYNQKYPNYKDYFTNEQRAFYFDRQVYANTMEALEEGDFRPVEGQPANAEAAFEYLKNATNEHIKVLTEERFASNENYRTAAALIMDLAIAQREAENNEAAIALYTQTLQYEEYLDNLGKRDLYISLALLNSEIKNYPASETWFRKALPYSEDSEEKGRIENDILVQIQNVVLGAEESGDYLKEAEERLRMASEMDPVTHAERILGQKTMAVSAYIKAQKYQEAIDLLLELSTNEPDIERVYTWYDQAVKIASDADKMNDPVRALALEKEFISKHPSSNYSFALRMLHLKAAYDDPVRVLEAAEGYYELYTEVQANQIDAGKTKAEDLLSDAIQTYSKTTNWQREYELIEEYARVFSQSSNTIPYLEYMAKGYYDRGEMQQYNRLAKDIFIRDPSRNSLYLHVAEKELAAIGTQASEAYDNKDYQAVFGFRDQYEKAEAAFKKEGLSFQNEVAHKFFADVKKEYDDLKKYEAYLANYDKQLAALKRSALFTKSPADHIRLNYATTWDKHLGAGEKRFEKFQKVVKDEANKVQNLISQANDTGYYIDNNRRIEAIDLLAKIHKRGAEVIDSTIERYFRTATEAEGYRHEFPGDSLWEPIRQLQSNLNYTYLNDMLAWQYIIYRSYHAAGYQNELTLAAENSLKEYNLVPEYRSQDYPLDASWQQELVEGGAALSLGAPNQVGLGTLDIPAQKTLRLSKSFSLNLEPDLAYLQIMFPQELKIKLNGSLIDPDWVPIDTLTVDKPATTRYALILPSESFVAGENNIELELSNTRETSQNLAFALQLKTSEMRIRENIPPIVSYIHTNSSWRVISIDPDSGEESSGYAVAATNWGITWDEVFGFERTAATPIWVNEAEEAPVSEVILETDFILDTDFRGAQIDLIAPDNVSIYLNGNLIQEVVMDYDPEPFAVYAEPIEVPAAYVQMGKNTLRFVINNNSEYRGFLSSITYSKAGKENPR
ncbi:MAG: hypothetical protein PHC50_07190 [Candidatus Cloacimonetes bacterium]|nr:hypothetical protein [Candidatus Cloacimonadota bacterium]